MSESEFGKNIPSDELQGRLRFLAERLENEPMKSAEDKKKEIMLLMHEFNKVKDATQVVLGALANIDGVTFKEMHLKYNLPLE